jgi:hypothetical protein
MPWIFSGYSSFAIVHDLREYDLIQRLVVVQREQDRCYAVLAKTAGAEVKLFHFGHSVKCLIHSFGWFPVVSLLYLQTALPLNLSKYGHMVFRHFSLFIIVK